ncbi:D-alanyl-D-alanine carboxypeptidase/D-alanyl-D-alanine-endopeptidase (penicillin-binding protein 4) [Pontibacter aydingkolensis]|uniref:D-alanyl-D-alanine carboxypeptidase n=1 Tax=Pontibacter aydingkolensis TaxID=1911536 RepID=A0ABS7CVW2_9BACT|nr:D-alanyl-D-alanine carboxypeptidase [Pontibacter aydingkolensis]MBW7467925.1 D-alanyl-D-alanine carboxypeptidase [Pontibacter aydingkolensis]
MQNKAAIFSWKIILGLLLIGQTSCITQKKPEVTAEVYGPATILQQVQESEKKVNRFVGFALFDPELGKMVVEHNADKYFVPASNTKLFTFYTSLKMLGDTIPALKYTVRGDSLLFWGTGDPTFAHMDLKNSIAYNFLKNRKEKLYYIEAPFASTPFAVNWGWDDYNYYYQPERSIFPIHGNIVKFYRKENSPYTTTPAHFKANVKADTATLQPQNDSFVREWRTNDITFYPKVAKADFSVEVPFITSPETTMQLLSDTLKREVKLLKQALPKTAITLPGLPSDSVYKRMLQVSDNLMAEQLLVLSSGTISDTLSVEKSIKYVLDNYLQDLPDKPVWVDGSGLSSMNMFTPRSIIALLQKLQQERPNHKLLPMLAVGGRPGTFRNIYKADVPFVFGKSGTLSHVHNQSGYIMTKSGKLLLFSFMNNNFRGSSAAVREEMVRIMTEIHEKY